METDETIRSMLRTTPEEVPAFRGDLQRVVVRAGLRRWRRRAAAGGIAVVLLAGVAVPLGLLSGLRRGDDPVGTFSGSSPSPGSASVTPFPSPSPAPTGRVLPGSPPPVVVRSSDGSVELLPHAYCYEDRCVNGAPSHVPHVGAAERLTVAFPLERWSFTALLTPAGEDCGRIHSTTLSPASDGTFSLEPIGYAGTYDVSLFGEADEGGDLVVAFRWTTPTDGPLPVPRAYLALLSNDDPVTSYGVELHVSNLATTPSSERAIITVRASNGRAITFEAEPADRDCLPEGTVFWDGPDARGLAAAELGEPPFTYEVELIIDGIHHVATARWPRDEIVGEEPAVLLEFSPALPALGER